MQTAAEKRCAAATSPSPIFKCVIPHQANIASSKRSPTASAAPMKKVYVNLHRYGNISAAPSPSPSTKPRAPGRFQRGDLILLVVFGSGLTGPPVSSSGRGSV